MIQINCIKYINDIFNNEKVTKFLKKFLRYYVYYYKLELNSGYIDVQNRIEKRVGKNFKQIYNNF